MSGEQVWLQLLIALIAPLLVALVVSWMGTRAYREQKKIDRAEQLLADKRASYSKVISAAADWALELSKQQSFEGYLLDGAKYQELLRATSLAALFAPSEMMAPLTELLDEKKFLDTKGEVVPRLRKMMRDDLGSAH